MGKSTYLDDSQRPPKERIWANSGVVPKAGELSWKKPKKLNKSHEKSKTEKNKSQRWISFAVTLQYAKNDGVNVRNDANLGCKTRTRFVQNISTQSRRLPTEKLHYVQYRDSGATLIDCQIFPNSYASRRNYGHLLSPHVFNDYKFQYISSPTIWPPINMVRWKFSYRPRPL